MPFVAKVQHFGVCANQEAIALALAAWLFASTGSDPIAGSLKIDIDIDGLGSCG